MDQAPLGGFRHRIWYGERVSSRYIDQSPPPPPPQRRPPNIHPHPLPHHLPQPRPTDILLPHPPPPLYDSRYSLSPRFSFPSPKRVIGRSLFSEPEIPRPEPYFTRDHRLTLFPSPPARDNTNLQFLDEICRPGPLTQGVVGNRIMYVGDDDERRLIHVKDCRRDLSMERHIDVNRFGRFNGSRPDLGSEWDFQERWINSIDGQCREFYSRRDDSDQRWPASVHDRGRVLCNDKEYAERRPSIGVQDRGLLLCSERSSIGVQDRGHLLCNEREYFDSRCCSLSELDQEINIDMCWDGGMSASRMKDQVLDSSFVKDYLDRRYGINHRHHLLCTKVDGDARKRDHGYNEAMLPINFWPEGFVWRDSSCDGDKAMRERPMKRQRLMNADVFGQFRKDCNRDLTVGTSSRGEKERCQRIKTASICNRESCQYPKELAISFKSRSMVAKDDFFPSHPDVKFNFDLMNQKKKPVSEISGLSSLTSREELVKPKMVRRVDSLGNDSGKISKDFPDLTSSKKKRRVANQYFPEKGVHLENKCPTSVDCNNDINGKSAVHGLNLKTGRSSESTLIASCKVDDADHANRLVFTVEASDDTSELKFDKAGCPKNRNSSPNQSNDRTDSSVVKQEAHISRYFLQNCDSAPVTGNIEVGLKENDIGNAIIVGPSHNEATAEGPSRNEATEEGPSHNEATEEGPSHNEATAEGPSHNEATAEGPSHNEATAEGPSKIIVSWNGHDNVCFLTSESYRIPEIQPEINLASSYSEAGKALLQKPESAVIIHKEYGNSDLSVFSAEAELNAEDMKIEGATAFNGSSGITGTYNIFPAVCLLSDDGNDAYDSKLNDGMLSSGFARCSSVCFPKVTLDLMPSTNSEGRACEQKTEMMPAGDSLFNGKPMLEDLYEFSLAKSLDDEDDALDDFQILLGDTAFPSDNNEKLAKKINLISVEGSSILKKQILAAPQVFSHRPSLKYRRVNNPHAAHVANSRTWRRSENISVAVTEPKLESSTLPILHESKTTGNMPSKYIRKGNSLVRNPSVCGVYPPALRSLDSSVYKVASCTYNNKNTKPYKGMVHEVDASAPLTVKTVNVFGDTKSLPPNDNRKAVNCQSFHARNGFRCQTSDALKETKEAILVSKFPADSRDNMECLHKSEEPKKEMVYIKRKRNQLVAAPTSTSTPVQGQDKSNVSLNDGYYRSKKNQLVRKSSSNHTKRKACVNFSKVLTRATITKPYTKRTIALSKAFVWKLHGTPSSATQKVLPLILPWKRATYRRSCKYVLNMRENVKAAPANIKRSLLSRKKGTVYVRSSHGFSLKMSRVQNVAERSLKWPNPTDGKFENTSEEDACTSTAAVEQNKDGRTAVHIASMRRNIVHPGERIFRIGSERYKMDPKRRSLQRIADDSSRAVLQSQKNVEVSLVPRRLSIGCEQYVRIGNGNQLVRDPKRRTRILASEKVRWSLRTARLRMARKKKYCQFFTRYGKCNKDDGKCPYIHDPSKIAVCTKFLSGSCSNTDCKLTHKVISERMQDCSYFLKGLCTNDDCPYRHVNVDPNSSICESFLRGYCADGNECQKKHTYVCPTFEATGTCPQASTCKLHHPKKKAEKTTPLNDVSAVRGRYFDGGLVHAADLCLPTEVEKLPSKGKVELSVGDAKFPDYISLDVSDDDEEGEGQIS